jgi:hypothetical protein
LGSLYEDALARLRLIGAAVAASPFLLQQRSAVFISQLEWL